VPGLGAKQHVEHRPCTSGVVLVVFQSFYQVPLERGLSLALSKPPIGPGKVLLKRFAVPWRFEKEGARWETGHHCFQTSRHALASRARRFFVKPVGVATGGGPRARPENRHPCQLGSQAAIGVRKALR
jgi:hypothetical protein